MKTAMQEAIELFEKSVPIRRTNEWNKIKKYFLEKERHQIIDACKEFGNLNGVDDSDYQNYFNETFEI